MTLPAISTAQGAIFLLDANQPRFLAKSMGFSDGPDKHFVELENVIDRMVKSISKEFSGIVLGPEVGFNSLLNKSHQAGLLLNLNSTLFSADPEDLHKFVSEWGVEHIRNNYGWVKLDLNYHPGHESAGEKRKLVAEISDHCRYEQTKLLLEISLFEPKGTPNTQEAFIDAQLTAARELQALADVLVFEYPHTALACATLTAQLDTPWLLADRSSDYATFKEELRVACESGAQGALISQAILHDLPFLKTKSDQEEPEYWSSVEQFFRTEARDRAIELRRIIEEILATNPSASISSQKN